MHRLGWLGVLAMGAVLGACGDDRDASDPRPSAPRHAPPPSPEPAPPPVGRLAPELVAQAVEAWLRREPAHLTCVTTGVAHQAPATGGPTGPWAGPERWPASPQRRHAFVTLQLEVLHRDGWTFARQDGHDVELVTDGVAPRARIPPSWSVPPAPPPARPDLEPGRAPGTPRIVVEVRPPWPGAPGEVAPPTASELEAWVSAWQADALRVLDLRRLVGWLREARSWSTAIYGTERHATATVRSAGSLAAGAVREVTVVAHLGLGDRLTGLRVVVHRAARGPAEVEVAAGRGAWAQPFGLADPLEDPETLGRELVSEGSPLPAQREEIVLTFELTRNDAPPSAALLELAARPW